MIKANEINTLIPEINATALFGSPVDQQPSLSQDLIDPLLKRNQQKTFKNTSVSRID